MVNLCYRCKRRGHIAMFCPFDTPNERSDDSGYQAFNELPYNTHRWTELRPLPQEAVNDLTAANTDWERVEFMQDFMAAAFASGWQYCCWKLHHNSKSHKAEPRAIDPDSKATATTDVDSEGSEDYDSNILKEPAHPMQPATYEPVRHEREGCFYEGHPTQPATYERHW